jgi:hypothetical protein
MRKRSRIVVAGGFVAVVIAGSVTAALASGSSPSGGAATLAVATLGVTPANSVEEAVEQSENARLATLSPLATTPSQSMNCQASNCDVGSAVASLSSEADAANTLIDNPAIGPGTGVEAAIKPSTNTASTQTALSVTKIVKRNSLLLSGLFVSTLASFYEKSSERVVTTENRFLNGSFTGCTSQYDCPIVGAAGAEVTKFTNEVMNSTTATVTATVHGWQDDARYSGPNVPLSWQRVSGTLIVTDTLQRQADGSWLVVKRHGTFASGSGP